MVPVIWSSTIEWALFGASSNYKGLYTLAIFSNHSCYILLHSNQIHPTHPGVNTTNLSAQLAGCPRVGKMKDHGTGQ